MTFTISTNDTAKGWGAKKVGALVAKFKGKPELSADHFDGRSAHDGDATIGGGDIKDQIASAREGLSEGEESRLYGETLINPKKGLESIRKAGKKEGYSFDKDELADALNEMDQAGAFIDIEFDDAAMALLLGNASAIGQANGASNSWSKSRSRSTPPRQQWRGLTIRNGIKLSVINWPISLISLQ